MRLREVPLDAVDGSLLARWAELATHAVDPNPFFEPDFVLPAVRYLRDGPVTPALLTVEDGDRLRGCVPVVRRDRWRRVRRVTLSTWIHDYCFVGTPLIDRDDPAETVSALVRGATDGQFVALERVTGKFGSTLDSMARGTNIASVVYEQFTRPSLEAEIDGTVAPFSVSSQRRRRLRRLARRLGDELGGSVRIVTGTSGSTPERFLELEGSGWKGRAGTAFRCRPGHDEFFREVCSRFDATGRLRVDTLMVGDRTVAMVCSFLAGGTRFLFKSAFDEQLARFSPGTQLLIASCDGTTTPIDSCGTAHWLDDVFPDRRPVRTLLFPPAGRLDALTAFGLRGFVWARDGLRRQG